MIRGKRLGKGARISVVAPSGPVPRERFLAGADKLGKHFTLVYSDRLFTVDGYLAGTDQARARELRDALCDPTTDAVWIARGGYGLMRILEQLEPQVLARPKPILGFSDVTVLHAFAAHAGHTSIHAPVVTQLAELGELDLQIVCDVAGGATTSWQSLQVSFGSGLVEGITAGGNLEMLSRLAGTRWQWPLEKSILLLEEVSERPYRIDRALEQMRLSGYFEGLAGVVVGDLTNCEESKGPSATAQEVLLHHFSALRIPIAFNAPFGHGYRNHAFGLGVRARLNLDAGELTFLESAVD